MLKPLNIFTKLALLVMLSGFWACNQNTDNNASSKNKLKADTTDKLQEIINRRKLVALTDYNSVNYYIYRGEPMGYQYEMLQKFTEHLGIRLELRIEENLQKGFKLLNKDKVDLIAMGLTVTGKRQSQYDFTDPIIITRQVLVQRMPEGWQKMATRDEIEGNLLRSSLELAGKTIHVEAGSIFKKRLETLMDEIADTIYIIEDKREVEDLIAAVANGEIEYTIADEHIALINERIYPDIDAKMPISFPQKLAWAVKKEQDKALLNEINQWLQSYNNTLEARVIYNKYFKNNRVRYLAKSEYTSFNQGRLSAFDETIKAVANEIGWDWRLLASLIYQESEFNPDAVSWAGAYGLMQLMPVVMEQFGIDSTASPEEQIRIGGKFIQYLNRQIPASVTDSAERIKFILASYNAGVGHVLDARRLAKKYKKDPDVWTEQTDFFLLNKSKPAFYHDSVVYYGYARGEETYAFVEQITDRYDHYRNLILE
ncbi:MAG: transporter substrate-binding domain-containing protein [Bacteroidetes bacterium]|nr:transporter substrate-binding domain-containing protein [Bacteroidota bacterium]MBU1580341.1 transporter substrate-binding domain-containing protein [Bacteroidota bacterium]MBU2557082.1 transporter substrate-binding domain-containing protein [Bacteroidota bacterium]